MKTIPNLNDIQDLTASSKKRITLNLIKKKKESLVKERNARREQIKELKDVSFYVDQIKEAARRGRNRYRICLYHNPKDFTGNVYNRGKFNKTFLSEYSTDNVIHMKAIVDELKKFSPRIFVKGMKTDNMGEYLYSESNSIEYCSWMENLTYVEFTW